MFLIRLFVYVGFYCTTLLTVSKAEFRDQFPSLDKLQDIGFIA